MKPFFPVILISTATIAMGLAVVRAWGLFAMLQIDATTALLVILAFLAMPLGVYLLARRHHAESDLSAMAKAIERLAARVSALEARHERREEDQLGR